MEHNWRLEMSLEKTKQTAFSTNNRNSLAMNYLDVISYHPFSTTGKRSSNFLCINPRCLWSRKPTSSWCTNDLIIVINLARTHGEINFVRGNSHRIELCHSQHQRQQGKAFFFPSLLLLKVKMSKSRQLLHECYNKVSYGLAFLIFFFASLVIKIRFRRQ